MHIEGESEFRAWDELAPDVLGLVFKKLELQEVMEAIPLVCKSWCNVVKGPYCWDEIDLYNWSWTNRSNPMKIDRMLRTLVTRSSGTLRELSVSLVGDHSFSFIIEHAGSLQTLSLDSCTISDSMVEQMAPRLSSLTNLKVFYCYELSTRALQAIGMNCKALVSLTWVMRDNTRSPKDEVLTISRTMPKLKHLSFSQLIFNNLIVLELLSGCPELELLHIQVSKSDTLDWKFLEENYPKLKLKGPGTLSDSDDDDDDDSNNSGDNTSDESIEPQDDYYGSNDPNNSGDNASDESIEPQDDYYGSDDYGDFDDSDSDLVNNH